MDLQILGIGTDGHIVFNEPGSSLASRTRIDNARFFGGDLDAVPTHCLPQGPAIIMAVAAQDVLLAASGSGNAEAVHHLAEGAVSALWPASILQHHLVVGRWPSHRYHSRSVNPIERLNRHLQ